MQKQTTTKEANKLLHKLIRLRLKKNKTDYYIHEQHCSQVFDYLVISRVAKYKEFPNYEDLKQEGRLALILALRNFDPKKGSFWAWADQYISTKVKRQANKHSVFHIPLKHVKNTNSPFKVLQLPILVDSAMSALQLVEMKELSERVKKELNNLPAAQKKVLELNGIKSYSINQISKELNMTRSDCMRLLNEAKQTIKQNLNNLY